MALGQPDRAVLEARSGPGVGEDVFITFIIQRDGETRQLVMVGQRRAVSICMSLCRTALGEGGGVLPCIYWRELTCQQKV